MHMYVHSFTIFSILLFTKLKPSKNVIPLTHFFAYCNFAVAAYFWLLLFFTLLHAELLLQWYL